MKKIIVSCSPAPVSAAAFVFICNQMKLIIFVK